MSATIVDASRGIVTVEIRGVLNQAEFAAMQQKAGELLLRAGPSGVLIRAEGFEGWGAGGEKWGDVTFQLEQDHLIKKLAIVGKQEWEDQMLAFVAKGLRPFEIEYFLPARVADALAWLERETGR